MATKYDFTIKAEFTDEEVLSFAKRKNWDGVSDLGDFVKVETQKMLVEQICGSDLEQRLEAEAIVQSKEQAKQLRSYVASKIIIDVKNQD